MQNLLTFIPHQTVNFTFGRGKNNRANDLPGRKDRRGHRKKRAARRTAPGIYGGFAAKCLRKQALRQNLAVDDRSLTPVRPEKPRDTFPDHIQKIGDDRRTLLCCHAAYLAGLTNALGHQNATGIKQENFYARTNSQLIKTAGKLPCGRLGRGLHNVCNKLRFGDQPLFAL